jgi:hypothetical protein
MKEAHHPGRHPSRHVDRHARSSRALRLRVARQSILDAGKTPSWAGATPLLGAFGCPKNRGVAPAQGTERAFLFAECFARVQESR